MDGWLAAAVGIVVMAGHAALRVVTHWISRRSANVHAALGLEVGGLLLRMLLLLGVMVLVLVFTSVHKKAFAGTVLALLVLSLIVEIWAFSRRETPDAPRRE
jgi:uncharacterized membrane protein YqjE